MRILHALNRLNDSGNGIVNVAVDLALEQRRQGHEVSVASAGGDFLPLLRQHAISHHDIDFRRRRPLALIRAYRELSSTLARMNPDIMHAHTITPTVLGFVATRRRRAALVATVHNEYQHGVTLMRLADRVVGVSEAVSRAMAERGVSRDKIRTVLNGTVGSQRRSPLHQSEVIDLPPCSIVTVGAVSHRKGADVLLAAFEQVLEAVPEAHLYFVGNVEWQEPVDAARRMPWSDRVHFVGFESQPQRYLRSASVFALASRRDPMPLALIEALEAGAPIVASDVDGIPEALDSGNAGLLADVGDSADFAAKISGLLRSEDARRELARAAAERVSRLTVEAMAGKYLEVYRGAACR